MVVEGKPQIIGLPPTSKSEKKCLPQRQQMNAYSDENGYFESYGHFGIHEEMLKDKVRTETYKNAIMNNTKHFEGKIVLDVGSGTGILSMFAAMAGAKHVYAVEMAEIAELSKKIIKANGFESQITVIRGKIEEIKLPVGKVDIIISEWMGYLLLFESMLDSVLFARDKWLVNDGLIFPDKATLYIAGIEDFNYKKEKIHYWDKVYGFDMSCIKNEALKEPLIDTAEHNSVVTDIAKLISIDLYTVKPKNLTFEKLFTLKAIKGSFMHAFIAFFDVEFNNVEFPAWFSTGPHDITTHWKQTIFYTDKDLMLSTGDSIFGSIKLRRNQANFREMDISIRSTFKDDRNLKEKVTQKRWYFLR